MSTNTAFVTDPAHEGLSVWRRAGLADGELAHLAAPAAATGNALILGSSAALRGVMERVARVAPTTATVLITGETGTGKELIARAIHAASPRAKRPLVKVNCAALPEGLLESELFGHERGAFTGAVERRKGRFELANGGTIFLDEIGELSPAMQVELLRVLQEGEFERVGGTETLKTDVRVVAATNRDLDEAVRQGRFRADLLFRLNVVPIAVPPLRERAGDVRLIAEHHARRYASTIGKRVAGLSPLALGHARSVPVAGQRARAAERRRARRDPHAARGAGAGPVRVVGLLGRRDHERRAEECPGAHRARTPSGARPRGRQRWSRGVARRVAQHARLAHPPAGHRQARFPFVSHRSRWRARSPPELKETHDETCTARILERKPSGSGERHGEVAERPREGGLRWRRVDRLRGLRLDCLRGRARGRHPQDLRDPARLGLRSAVEIGGRAHGLAARGSSSRVVAS